MSDYTPNELDFIDTYVSAMSGGCTPNEDPERAKEAKRGIDKVKADAVLTAVEKVLEVISKIDREHSKAPGDDAYADGMCDAAYMFDTALSEAIEGAIK